MGDHGLVVHLVKYVDIRSIEEKQKIPGNQLVNKDTLMLLKLEPCFYGI